MTLKQDKEGRSLEEDDGVLATGIPVGCIRLPVGWGGSSVPLSQARLPEGFRLGNQRCCQCSSQPSVDPESQTLKQAQKVNCGCGLTKTEGNMPETIRALVTTRLHGMSLSQSPHVALQASDNESQQLHYMNKV